MLAFELCIDKLPSSVTQTLCWLKMTEYIDKIFQSKFDFKHSDGQTYKVNQQVKTNTFLKWSMMYFYLSSWN